MSTMARDMKSTFVRFRRWLAVALLVVASPACFAQSTETVAYYYTNPQGTPLATADASGNILTTADYRPYGSQVLGSPIGGPGYTGHVNDPDSGLVYMLARYYDPVVGRFLSIDPSNVQVAGDNFNRYEYAGSNPARFTDSNGRDITCTGGTCVLVPIGGGLPPASFARPDGFPDKISESASSFHHVYRFTDPAGKGDDSYAKRLNQALVNNPTPMPGQAATSGGTMIDVNANNAISRFTGKDDLMSYKIALGNGSNAVLNVTTSDHAASYGVVYRLTQSGNDGQQSIITYGEGNSALQYLFDNTNGQSRKVWSQSAQEIEHQAEANGN